MKDDLKGGEKEMEKVNIQKVAYRDKCFLCGKEIMGTSESQVKYNLDIHLITQHKDKLQALKAK